MLNAFNDFAGIGSCADQVENICLIEATVLKLFIHHIVQNKLEILAQVIEEQEEFSFEAEVVTDVKQIGEVVHNVAELDEFAFQHTHKYAEE